MKTDTSHKKDKNKVNKVDQVNEVNKDKKNKKPLKGLCINCEHRDTCTLPRPETGVWYCEEYE